jgi:hypothetical protein
MNTASKIEAKLAGSEKEKNRRAKLLAELGGAFSERGPQAITDEMVGRMDSLADAFTHQLRELKQLI